MARFNRNLVSNGTNWVNCLVFPIKNMDDIFFFGNNTCLGKKKNHYCLQLMAKKFLALSKTLHFLSPCVISVLIFISESEFLFGVHVESSLLFFTRPYHHFFFNHSVIVIVN